MEEIEKGRIPLWLAPNDILFLLNEWRKIPENAENSVMETWNRVAFRASTALHKNGITNEATLLLDTEKYTLEN